MNAGFYRLPGIAVPGAMFAPVLGMAGGHVQVERWRGDNRGHGLDDDRLGVEDGRGWQGAEVNTAIQVDRHPSSGTHRQSSSQDAGGQKASHTKSLYQDCLKSSMDYSLAIIPCSTGMRVGWCSTFTLTRCSPFLSGSGGEEGENSHVIRWNVECGATHPPAVAN